MLKKKKHILVGAPKHGVDLEKLVILLMISNGEKQWDYLELKKLLALLRGVT